MIVKTNLDIQKKYFPEIYLSYSKDNSKEIAITKLEKLDEIEEEKIIQIVCDNPYPILREIFMVPEYMLRKYTLDEYEEFQLVKGVYESADDLGKKLKIVYPIPFNLKYHNVIISKKVQKDIINRRSIVFIIKENLNLFESNYLKKISYKVETISDLNQLELKLLEHRPVYKLEYLTISNRKVEKLNDKRKVLTEEYKNILLSDLIKIVIDSNEESSKLIVKKLEDKLINSYKKEGLTIIRTFLRKGSFLNNFKIVERYIKNEEELIKVVSGNYRVTLEKYILNLSVNKKSRQLGLLLNGEIKDFENILSISLNSLIDFSRRIGDDI